MARRNSPHGGNPTDGESDLQDGWAQHEDGKERRAGCLSERNTGPCSYFRHRLYPESTAAAEEPKHFGEGIIKSANEGFSAGPWLIIPGIHHNTDMRGGIEK